MHALNVANHVVQRRVISQNKVFIDGQAELISNVSHDFGLFDRVNTQFTFEILIQFNEIGRIAGVFHHDGHDRCGHGSIVDLRRRCWGRGW